MRTFRPHGFSPALDKRLSDFLKGVSRAHERMLILDYDGTLAPFCIDLDRATPYPEIHPVLRRLKEDTDTRLVIVTGRSASSAARLLDMPGLAIWGCHGLERLKTDGTLEVPELPAESLQAIADATHSLCNDGLGEFAERKFGSIAIHWRGKDALARHLTHRVLRTWSTIQRRQCVRLVPFDGGIEITIAARDKGDAVKTILSESGRDCAVAYLGDETTDEAAFGALKGSGLNVLVREEYRRTLADVWIRPPDDVAAFLSGWIASCQVAA